MIYLILSDIHGNLPALEAVLKKESGNYDEIINLGDVVNYAPWSNECVELIDTLPRIINLSGNHEEYFIKGEYSNPGKVSELFFKTVFPEFTRTDLIMGYRDNFILNGINFTHTINDQYIFADTVTTTQSTVCIGHSHRQYRNDLNQFSIINPGSVGQNREFINIISYALYYADENRFDLRQMRYDVDIVIGEMKARKFPADCINYYQEKNRA